jgi:hypothetical protein
MVSSRTHKQEEASAAATDGPEAWPRQELDMLKSTRTTIAALALGTGALTMTACGGGGAGASSAPSTHTVTTTPAHTSVTSSTATPSQGQAGNAKDRWIAAKITWHRVTGSGDDLRLAYIIHATNSGKIPADAKLQVKALDDSGTVVGHSADSTLPAIPPGKSFDYFGVIDTDQVMGELKGKPSKVEVNVAPTYHQGGSPLLKVSGAKLSKGDSTFTPDSLPYDLRVKVTNDTEQPLSDFMVHQQVILYDTDGQPVGGSEGSSDDQPDSLDAGQSYLETWTGIPAAHKAASVKYAVWVD